MTNPAPGSELRVLLKMVTAKDGSMVEGVLGRAGMQAEICTDAFQIASKVGEGAGALLIAEELLVAPGFESVMQALRSQPTWSDIPMVVLARGGADSLAIGDLMREVTSISILERPIRVSTLVSALRTALTARRRQFQLRAMLTGLQEADRRKTEFLATLAHELRNPLAPLRTSLALLARKQPEPAEAAPVYELMDRQVSHMVRLIDDLMEVSRITRGKIDLQLETIELDKVVHDAIELSKPLVQASRHRLRTTSETGPWIVRGDFVRLTQVFANLLNNAAKYTPPGGQIEIEMQHVDGLARIAVHDNGIGIESHLLDSVFEMFVQISDTSRAAQGGLGIGLTLVRSLVELHGGTVVGESAGLGRGTSFVVELPLVDRARASPPQAYPHEPLELQGRRVLVVDDNRDAADMLQALLQSLGAEARAVYDGAQAVRIAPEFEPAIVFLDIGMPGMDGYELAARLRTLPALADLMLVALTGWGQRGDRHRISNAGFDHHLVKPAQMEDIVAILGSVPARSRHHSVE